MKSKKILIISPVCPIPEDVNGTSLIVHNIAKTLSSSNSVTVLYSNPRCEDFISRDEIPYQLGSLEFKQRARNFLKYLYLPRNSHWTIGKDLALDINERFDLVIVFRLDMGFFFSNIINQAKYRKIVFYPIDLVSSLYSSLKVNEKFLIMRFYYFYQEKLLRYWEGRFLKIADLNVFVSGEDSRLAQIICPDLVNIRGFRNGVESYYGSYNVREHLDSCRIGFSGDFSYKPNRDAAHFIINNISPILSTRVESFDIYLIGRNPDDLMIKAKSFGNVRFHVTNEVDSIDVWLEKLDIYICPLFSGAGMKNKILKAMSIGLPIISTGHGVEGIDEHVDGESYISTNIDDINSWIANIDLLINSYSIRSSMSSKGKEIVGERYSWHSVVSDIAGALESCRK